MEIFAQEAAEALVTGLRLVQILSPLAEDHGRCTKLEKFFSSNSQPSGLFIIVALEDMPSFSSHGVIKALNESRPYFRSISDKSTLQDAQCMPDVMNIMILGRCQILPIWKTLFLSFLLAGCENSK